MAASPDLRSAAELLHGAIAAAPAIELADEMIFDPLGAGVAAIGRVYDAARSDRRADPPRSRPRSRH